MALEVASQAPPDLPGSEKAFVQQDVPGQHVVLPYGFSPVSLKMHQ
jgi:hypothetical protein